MSKKGTGKLVLGASLGAGLALLFAPKKGSELRENLKNRINDLVNRAKEVDVKEVQENLENKMEEIKNEIEDLDKEKVKWVNFKRNKIAEKKAKELKKKTEELVEYAKEKGTPVLEKAAKEVKKQAANVCKEVLNKLEENND